MRFVIDLKQNRVPKMIDNRELIGLCSGISLLAGDRTRLAGACDDRTPFEADKVLEALSGLSMRSLAQGVRLDLTPGILDRILGVSRPPRPKREWFLARKDLAFVWEAALMTEPTAIGLSLSHADGAWLAAARALDDDASKLRTAQIGVDIEVADRVVSDRLLKRFSNPEDLCPGVTRIGLWAAKEALYKADPDSAERTLKDYAVGLALAEKGLHKGTGVLPSGKRYAACLAGNGRYILAAAADTSPPTR